MSNEVEAVKVVKKHILPVINEEDIEELKHQYDMFRKLQQKVLEKDIDYGWPAKRTSQKPSLYKSGAEKLTRLFNLIPKFELVQSIERDDFIMYKFKCVLKSVSGQVIGEGYGAANSREKTHWREDPWVHQNTILKMAKKRAHVDAVLTGLGASNVFTQDIEDYEDEMPQEVHVKVVKKSERKENGNQLAITEQQRRYLWKLIRDYAELKGKDPEQVEEWIKQKSGVEHLKDMPREMASKWIDKLKTAIEKQQKINREVLEEGASQELKYEQVDEDVIIINDEVDAEEENEVVVEVEE